MRRPKSLLAIGLYLVTGIGGWLAYDHYSRGGRLAMPAVSTLDATLTEWLPQDRQGGPAPVKRVQSKADDRETGWLPAWPGAVVSAKQVMQLVHDATHIEQLWEKRQQRLERVVNEGRDEP